MSYQLDIVARLMTLERLAARRSEARLDDERLGQQATAPRSRAVDEEIDANAQALCFIVRAAKGQP